MLLCWISKKQQQSFIFSEFCSFTMGSASGRHWGYTAITGSLSAPLSSFHSQQFRNISRFELLQNTPRPGKIRPTQPPILSWTRNENQPKCSDALQLGSKGMYNNAQQQPFYGPLSSTTRVSQYQKKHSPTNHPDHHPIFISFFHLPPSTASSLFKLRAWQSFCTTSFHVLFGLPLGLEPSTSYSIHLFTQSVSSDTYAR